MSKLSRIWYRTGYMYKEYLENSMKIVGGAMLLTGGILFVSGLAMADGGFVIGAYTIKRAALKSAGSSVTMLSSIPCGLVTLTS